MIGRLPTDVELDEILADYSDEAKRAIIARENGIDSVIWDNFLGEHYLEVSTGFDDIISDGWEFFVELTNSSLYVK